MKKLTSVFLVSLLMVFFEPANLTADGVFVTPKSVWDKPKDINEPTQKAVLVYDDGREDLTMVFCRRQSQPRSGPAGYNFEQV